MYQGMYPGGSLGLNESSQLNLYQPTTYDSPFGLADQEWLSRDGDIDDDVLSNRIPYLLGLTPSNSNTYDLHRKMLSVDSWETNTFSAANMANAPFSNDFNLPAAAVGQDASGTIYNPMQPALSHGNKKINLNYPLPSSHSSNEPVRQKWVREAYQMFKMVQFPPYFDATGKYYSPESQATAEQLAALGQFAVNIVDFRDPDDTMTAFQNYDLTEVAPGTITDPNSTATPKTEYYTPASVAKVNAASNTAPLTQYGMEYNPIAISEILAYEYTYKDVNTPKTPKQQQRLFVELINTLSQDGAVSGNGQCDLDLRGWGFIITKDDPTVPQTVPTYPIQERPNYITGQLYSQTIANNFVPLNGTAAMPTPLASKIPAQPSNATSTNNLSYYVMSNTTPLMTNFAEYPQTPLTTNIFPATLMNQLPVYQTSPNSGRGRFRLLLAAPAPPGQHPRGRREHRRPAQGGGR